MAYLTGDIIHDFWELYQEPLFPFEHLDEITLSRFKEMYLSYQQKLIELRDKLNKLPKHHLEKNKSILVNQLEIINSKLEDGKQRSISRNQGLIIDNAVYSEIMSSIIDAVKNQIEKPLSLYRTSNPKDQLDPEPLMQIIQGYLERIKSKQFQAYGDLIEVVDELVVEIRGLLRNGERKMRKVHV